MNTTYRLGIDIGSTTVKIACLNDENQVVFSDYERHFANIRETLLDLIIKAKKQTVKYPLYSGSYFRFHGASVF